MLAGEDHRCALEEAELVFARELAEGDHRAAESDRADRCAQEEFEPVAGRNRGTRNDVGDDRAGLRLGADQQFLGIVGDAEGPGLDHCGNCDADRGQADHAVHEGDQLGHLGHLDLGRHVGPGTAADDQTEQHPGKAHRREFGAHHVDERDRGERGNAHADHAEEIAPDGGGGMRQALERLDEADRGDEIQQDNEVHVRPGLRCGAVGCCG